VEGATEALLADQEEEGATFRADTPEHESAQESIPTVLLSLALVILRAGPLNDGRYCPLPVRVTTCWLVNAESVNVRAPVTGPVAVGEKVTPIVQLAPAPTLAPQVLLATANPVLAVTAAIVRALLR